MKEESDLGTPIVCSKCGFETKERLFKGTKIKTLWCPNCHSFGDMKRNTDYDKERRKKSSG